MYVPVALLFTLLSVSSQFSFANSCPDFWVSFNEYCYRYFGAHTSWTKAEETCTGLGQAHLVSIHSKEEFDFVYNLWAEMRDDFPHSNYTLKGLWIGLTDEGHEKVFTYTDGSSVPDDFDAFPETEPNNGYGRENYVVIKDVGRKDPFWNDALDEMPFQFMCKQSP